MNVGTFDAPTSTGSQAVTGVGFQPNALLVWSSGTSSDAIGDGAGFSFGIASAADEQAVCAIRIDDGATGGATERYSASDAVAVQVNTSGVVGAQGELASFDSDGFTIDWTTAPAAGVVHNYAAIATQDAVVGQITAPSSATSQQVSGVGFRPDAVILITASGTATGAAAGAQASIGMASAVSEQWSVFVADADAANPTEVLSRGDEHALIGASGDLVVDLQSLDEDGFTLDFASVPAYQPLIWYLALQGGRYFVGSVVQGTSASQIASAPFLPSGALALSTGSTAATLSSTSLELVVGASDGGNNRSTWLSSDDNVATSNAASWSGDNFLAFASAGSLVAEAESALMTPLGASVTWSLNDSTSRIIGFLSVGGTSIVNPDSFYRCGATGNARHLVSGTALKNGTLRWRVDGGVWTTVSLVAGNAYREYLEHDFQQGVSYNVQVEAVAGSLVDTLFDDDMLWTAGRYSVSGGWALSSPEWIRSSEMVASLWEAFALHYNDMYAMLDDMQAQSDPLRATWAIPVWEEIVGIRQSATRTYAERRTAVMNRRIPIEGTREDFFAAVNAMLGADPEVTDTYGDLRTDIRLAVSDPALRTIVERVVAVIKPVGLQVVTTYGDFRAGVSRAGDPL